jgi:hypothetical protein
MAGFLGTDLGITSRSRAILARERRDFAYLRSMGRKAAALCLGALAGTAAFACISRTFTIIPTSGTSWKLMDAIERRREDVVLVTPREFGGAAPVEVASGDGVRRRFLIGDALQSVTREYFDHAFGTVTARETRPADAGAAAFVVEPELTHFSVHQSWTGKYHFEVALRARASSPGGESLGTFDGVAKEATFGNEATLGPPAS